MNLWFERERERVGKFGIMIVCWLCGEAKINRWKLQRVLFQNRLSHCSEQNVVLHPHTIGTTTLLVKMALALSGRVCLPFTRVHPGVGGDKRTRSKVTDDSKCT